MRVRLIAFIAVAVFLFAAGTRQSSAAVLAGSIEYAKSGGIAGIEESMKIDRNARGKIGKKSFRLPSREGRSLAAAIRRADLARVRSPKGGGCCDFFQYSISYRGRTVTWDESTAEELPARVIELQERLSDIYERYAPR